MKKKLTAAPELKLPTADEGEISLTDFKKKTVLVSFLSHAA